MGKFLKWTGHQKAIASVFGICMLGCLMVIAISRNAIDDRTGIWVLLAGFAIAIPSLIGLCIFVRCPRCRVRIIWHAVSKDAPTGLNGLLLAAKCPFCGFASRDGGCARQAACPAVSNFCGGQVSGTHFSAAAQFSTTVIRGGTA